MDRLDLLEEQQSLVRDRWLDQHAGHRTTFVSVANAFHQGHELCANGKNGIWLKDVSIPGYVVALGNVIYFYHPNADEQQGYADAIKSVLKD